MGSLELCEIFVQSGGEKISILSGTIISLHTFPKLIIDPLFLCAQMLLVNPNVESYRVDEDGKPIFSSEYNNTESDLENYLNELRSQ